jgi:hypothetical protein
MSDDTLTTVPDQGDPERPVRPPPPVLAAPAHLPAKSTRNQRIALLVGLLVVTWLALQLFASVLLPFVAAAGIAYVLDPPTRRLCCCSPCCCIR